MSRREWTILLLLAASAFLNYFDRITLSVAATDIQREFHITNTELGSLHSAFFAAYSICQISFLAGWVVGRFSVGWVLAGGFFLWTCATAATGMMHVFAVIVVLRVILGIGESVTYPSYSRILSSGFPEHHRGLANALIDAATKAAPAAGALLGGLLVARYGWRPFFFALGAGTLIWLAPWIRSMPRGALAVREDGTLVPSVVAILRQRSMWFGCLAQFCANYFWYFLMTWLPAYLEKERHFPKTKMALFAWLPFLAIAVSDVISGWASDRLIEHGYSPTLVRKTFAGVGMAGSLLVIGVAMVRSDVIAIAILTTACAIYGIYASQLFAIVQAIAGPHASGKWTSFQNGFANMAGIVAPWLTGRVLDVTGEFYFAFLLAGLIAVAGAAFWVFGVGRVEQVEFVKSPVRGARG
jgi:MFS family permease